MRRSMRYLLVCAMLPTSIVRAQATATDLEARCERAAAIVARGYVPTNERWALAYMGNCLTQAGPAIASGMRSLRTSSDTSQLESTTLPTRQLRDASVFHAAMELAADPGATKEARLYSLRTLWWYVHDMPGNLSYGELLHEGPLGEIGDCFVPVPASDGYPVVGVALPADARDRTKALGNRLAADATAPNSVRNLGWCMGHLP